jgi:hypothetical protein
MCVSFLPLQNHTQYPYPKPLTPLNPGHDGYPLNLRPGARVVRLPPRRGCRRALPPCFRFRITHARLRSRREAPPRQPVGGGVGGDRSAAAGAVEKGLRLAFLEQLAQRARAADAVGVADTIYDMVAAGLSPGPRSFHGLVVAHVLAGDAEGAVSVSGS